MCMDVKTSCIVFYACILFVWFYMTYIYRSGSLSSFMVSEEWQRSRRARSSTFGHDNDMRQSSCDSCDNTDRSHLIRPRNIPLFSTTRAHVRTFVRTMGVENVVHRNVVLPFRRNFDCVHHDPEAKQQTATEFFETKRKRPECETCGSQAQRVRRGFPMTWCRSETTTSDGADFDAP